jgi:hypothetical protein
MKDYNTDIHTSQISEGMTSMRRATKKVQERGGEREREGRWNVGEV